MYALLVFNMPNKITGIRGLNPKTWAEFKKFVYEKYGKKRSTNSILAVELEKAIQNHIHPPPPTHTHNEQTKMQQIINELQKLKQHGVKINNGVVAATITAITGVHDRRTIKDYTTAIENLIRYNHLITF